MTGIRRELLWKYHVFGSLEALILELFHSASFSSPFPSLCLVWESTNLWSQVLDSCMLQKAQKKKKEQRLADMWPERAMTGMDHGMKTFKRKNNCLLQETLRSLCLKEASDL